MKGFSHDRFLILPHASGVPFFSLLSDSPRTEDPDTSVFTN
jgi:hypothetical protein